MAGSTPGLSEHPAVGPRRADEAREVWPAREVEHFAAAIAGDRLDGLHHVVHTFLARGDKEHVEIIDAEMVVDRARGDDLAIGSDLWLDDGLDALGAHVGLKREVALTDREQGIRLDPTWRIRDDRHRHAKRVWEGPRAGRRRADYIDVIAKFHLRNACADLDVQCNMRRHVIMREAKDARRRGAVAANARHAHPIVRGDDPARLQQLLGVLAESIHFVDEKRVREFQLLAQSLQPLAGLVIEVRQAIAGLALIAVIEGDDLFCRELRVSTQRLKDTEDVVVSDRGALAARRRLRSRPFLMAIRGLHGGKGSARRAGCKRSLSRAPQRCDTVRQHVHTIIYYHAAAVGQRAPGSISIPSLAFRAGQDWPERSEQLYWTGLGRGAARGVAEHGMVVQSQ